MLETNPGEASPALDRVGRNHSSGCARHVAASAACLSYL